MAIGTFQDRVFDIGAVSRRERFQCKLVIRERFDLFSGWGSLLLHHFMEGYFFRGSLVLGTLYDMLQDPPRILYSGFFRQGRRHGALGVSYYPDGSMSYRGPWLFDEPHGAGQTFWKSGSLQYEGQFRNGRKEGLGKQHWATGT